MHVHIIQHISYVYVFIKETLVFLLPELGTWTAIVNELGLGLTRVDSDLDILDAEIFVQYNFF